MGNIRAITDVNPFLAVNHVNDEELLGIQENADNDLFDPIDLFDRNNNEENLRARIQLNADRILQRDEELLGIQEYADNALLDLITDLSVSENRGFGDFLTEEHVTTLLMGAFSVLIFFLGMKIADIGSHFTLQ